METDSLVHIWHGYYRDTNQSILVAYFLDHTQENRLAPQHSATCGRHSYTSRVGTTPVGTGRSYLVWRLADVTSSFMRGSLRVEVQESVCEPIR